MDKAASSGIYTKRISAESERGPTLLGVDARREKLIRKEIGARLRTARERHNLTLEDVAERIDYAISVPALSHYEHGRRRPGPLEILVLAQALQADPAYLLCVDSQKPANEMNGLHDDELRLIRAFRRLPMDDRAQYLKRLEALARIYADPVADERLPAAFHAPKHKKARVKAK